MYPEKLTIIIGPSGAGKRATTGILEDLFQYVSITKVDPKELLPLLKALGETHQGKRLAVLLESKQPDNATSFTAFSDEFVEDCMETLTDLKKQSLAFNVIIVYCNQSALLGRQPYGYHPLKAYCGSMEAAIFKECEMVVKLYHKLVDKFPNETIFTDTSAKLQDRLALLKDEINRQFARGRDVEPQTTEQRPFGEDFVTRGRNKLRNTLDQVAKARRFFAKKLSAAKAKSEDSGLNCLILGESGSGKELIANLIQDATKDQKQPYVAIDCASIPKDLIESELFGHEKGAFTSAINRFNGRVAAADGGTLFLDEIGLLDTTVQAKLLRFIEKKVARRIGSDQEYRVNCRIIAATSRDLKQEVKDGRFLPDLYYRLTGVTVNVPALRERREDIPLLIEYLKQKMDQPNKQFAAEVSAVLFDYDWPGNVRELRRVIERCCESDNDVKLKDLTTEMLLDYPGIREFEDHRHQISEADRQKPHEALDYTSIPEAKRVQVYKEVLGKRSHEDLSRDLGDVERNTIKEALKVSRGNVTKAAERLGFTRDKLYKKMRALAITVQRSSG